MSLPDRLERWFRPLALPNLTLTLVLGQAAMLLLSLAEPALGAKSALVWERVFEGEVWRLLSFVFVPPPLGIFVIFYFLIFHMMGTALEREWGDARYSAFVYVGLLAVAICGLFFPSMAVTALFVQGMIFIAFATLAPNFEILLIIIPVKVKYLAYLSAFGYLLTFAAGPNSQRALVFASVFNYLCFFGGYWIDRVKTWRRRSKFEAKNRKATAEAAGKARHTCTVCGVNNLIDPKMDFRYCSKCTGEKAYCTAHLKDHVCE